MVRRRATRVPRLHEIVEEGERVSSLTSLVGEQARGREVDGIKPAWVSTDT